MRSVARARCPLGLMFHRFRAEESRAWPQGAMTPGQLERLLRFVGIERILSPAAWLERLDRGTLSDDDRCLTFDDGLRSQMQYALPVLEHLGLQAFWFVSTSVFHGQPIKGELYSHAAARMGGMPVLIGAFLEACPAEVLATLRSDAFSQYTTELLRTSPYYSAADLQYRFIRNFILDASGFGTTMDAVLRARGEDPNDGSGVWLDETDVARLSSTGHMVGLHSWSHPYALALLTPERQRDEYARNQADLAAIVGAPPTTMSHPVNSYSAVTLDLLRELGVRHGFRADTDAGLSGRVNGDPLELAREDAANVLAEMGETA